MAGVDVVLVDEAQQAYEFKYGSAALRRSGTAFQRAYGSGVQVINQDNYLDFVLGSERNCQRLAE